MEQAIKFLESKSDIVTPRILDLGTGSGCVAVSIAKNLKQSSVTALDISALSLDVAKSNAKRHDVAHRIQFLNADIFKWLGPTHSEYGLFDLIISNPPYIPSDKLKSLPLDVQKEPVQALDGGPDGLSIIRHILTKSADHLTLDGALVMEIGDGQRPFIEKIFSAQTKFSDLKFIKDYVGTDRILLAFKKLPYA